MWTISETGSLEALIKDQGPEAYNQPRQKLPQTFWQTGHLDILRTDVILDKGSMSGAIIVPLVLDPIYTVDIDTDLDWERAEWKLRHGEMDVVLPGREKRSFPKNVRLVILDFDGVMTDNRVWTDADGKELIAADRSDGLGIARLKQKGIEVVVLSTEENPVVAARCEKLGLEVHQGLGDKGSKLKELLAQRDPRTGDAVYLGNDVNDLECFPLVECALVVFDAHPEAKAHADFVLSRPGGYGAVRELSDMILKGG
jgi:N-acylneuraminate cytidylyltransferase